jgi:hypothetical protein
VVALWREMSDSNWRHHAEEKWTRVPTYDMVRFSCDSPTHYADVVGIETFVRSRSVLSDGYLFSAKPGGREPLSLYLAYRIESAAAKAVGVYKLSPRDGRLMPA